MRFQNNIIDLDSPIIPGVSAAGLKLGILISDICKKSLKSFEFSEIHNKYLPDYPPLIQYESDDVILHFYDNKLTQIGLIGNYKGKLNNSLGLGNLVNEFELIYGKLTEGDEDELTFSNIQGLWFEVDNSKYNFDNWLVEIPKLVVKEIYIYKK